MSLLLWLWSFCCVSICFHWIMPGRIVAYRRCCSLASWILSYFWGVERLLQTTNSQGTREIILNPRSKIFQTHFSEPHFDLQSRLKLLTSKLSSTLVKSPILSQTEKEWFRFVLIFLLYNMHLSQWLRMFHKCLHL